ncbi:hypothetical protein SEA_SLOOPYJOE_63 [Arthrobacter phage Sloopyjoe]|nr:hypothetical protein PBI_STAYER_63 [Arthrobacter phage Stayer]QFG12657.1 hypothetical protein PBI_MICHELLE_63 [Arthrobacter phage Michelle]WAB09479.1 hypothetical protein SEA_SLOOPYJOE_63 [Arthrobacter phage Sloopyjoe]WKW85781.1 hypothetical protein SEA_MRAARONIAN_63 [Arthrobacter phage MrAaronian]WNO27665.1 hypothetical protein SEA_DJUNGELSKOG_62 [Arthrobacter phage Djungelskog]
MTSEPIENDRSSLTAEDEAFEQMTSTEAEVEVLEDRLPQAREVILPVNMRAGKDYAQLGDAIFDPETESLVVKFNTKAGRDIAELIGSGVLTGILFGGQMQRNSATNKLN